MWEVLLIIIFIVVLLSFIFSLMETSIFTVSDNFVEIAISENKKGSKSLKKVKSNINESISTIVVLNNGTNIVGSMIVGYIAGVSFNNFLTGLFAFSLIVLIIIVGEIIPKNLGSIHAERLSLISSIVVLFLSKIIYPIIYPLNKITNFLHKNKNKKTVTEKEIILLGELSASQGEILQKENIFLKNLFKLNDSKTEDVMTPKNEIFAFQKDSLITDIVPKLKDIPYSRVPIYGKDLNDIVGICLQRNIYAEYSNNNSSKKTLDSCKSKPIFVNNKYALNILLNFFQREKNHMAIVQNSYGFTLGLITLEDVLEELVGEIVDETDLEAGKKTNAHKKRRI